MDSVTPIALLMDAAQSFSIPAINSFSSYPIIANPFFKRKPRRYRRGSVSLH
jgi:hypothetical protein